MIKRIPFDWSNTAHTSIIEKFKITKENASKTYPENYVGYFPCDFKMYNRAITASLNGSTYTLEVSPAGNEPLYWVSGVLENSDNPYSAYVKDEKQVKENPRFVF